MNIKDILILITVFVLVIVIVNIFPNNPVSFLANYIKDIYKKDSSR